MQLFYPREISTSLEEKNRQLMSLMRQNNYNGGEHPDENDENMMLSAGDQNGFGDGDQTTGADGRNSLLFDFSNGGAGELSSKKRRPPNPNKDSYIQEPQYVTKRTSSGRLVKMKINIDYDYTSDQELEAAKKKRSKSFVLSWFYSNFKVLKFDLERYI